MNKHFEDAWYYLKRAGEHAKIGAREELAPVVDRANELRGKEPEPERTRVEQLQADVRELERRAEVAARDRLSDARERVGAYRGRTQESA